MPKSKCIFTAYCNDKNIPVTFNLNFLLQKFVNIAI